jgi:glycosyltransferase involved in cell wall biosynthesis
VAEHTASAPVVSVVTVCFNAARHLEGAITSVLAQTYPAIEHIVVDGGSTDGTLEIIRSLEPRFAGRLRWVSEPDAGIYDAMNKGIAMAKGELVGLLNADDEYVPDAVERIVAAWRADPSAGAIYGDVEVIGETGETLRLEMAGAVAPGTRPERLPFCHQSLFVARRVYSEIGSFDNGYRILADYEWLLRAIDRGVRFAHLPGVVARFRVGGVCSGDMGRSNAERERIRVAYGANPLVERLKRVRHAVNRMVYAAFTGVMRRTPTAGRDRR